MPENAKQPRTIDFPLWALRANGQGETLSRLGIARGVFFADAFHSSPYSLTCFLLQSHGIVIFPGFKHLVAAA